MGALGFHGKHSVQMRSMNQMGTVLHVVHGFCALAYIRGNAIGLSSQSPMSQPAVPPAAILQPTPGEFVLAGSWTARALAGLEPVLEAVQVQASTPARADASRMEALDTAGAWLLQGLRRRLARRDVVLSLHGLRPEFARLLDAVARQQLELADQPHRFQY